MLVSGIAQRMDGFNDMEENDDDRTHVLVRDLRPPFLDGKLVFTKQLEPINPVREPTGDLAVVARKGSHLVRQRREMQERQKVRLEIKLS
jgi:pre-mRNA-splicing factor ATP-dependent RNA helicase DHX38/PRP16